MSISSRLAVEVVTFELEVIDFGSHLYFYSYETVKKNEDT